MEDVLAVIKRAVNSSKGNNKNNQESFLIAIDGRCAAGKTTLASRLQEELDCNVIHMDYFFLQPSQRTTKRFNEPGGNVDYERFLEEVMIPLKKGKTFSYRRFDCKTMDFSEEIEVCPSKITIVEGAYSCHSMLWDYYDMRIFLNVEPEEQLKRILHRNGEKALDMFRERWIPLEEKYFSEYNIMERCDYIFN